MTKLYQETAGAIYCLLIVKWCLESRGHFHSEVFRKILRRYFGFIRMSQRGGGRSARKILTFLICLRRFFVLASGGWLHRIPLWGSFWFIDGNYWSKCDRSKWNRNTHAANHWYPPFIFKRYIWIWHAIPHNSWTIINISRVAMWVKYSISIFTVNSYGH